MTKSKCTIDIKQDQYNLRISIKSPKIQNQIKQITDKTYAYCMNGHYYVMNQEIQNKFMSKNSTLFVGKNKMPNLLPLFFKNYNTSKLTININTIEQKDIQRYCALVESAIKTMVKVFNSELFDIEYIKKCMKKYIVLGHLNPEYDLTHNDLRQYHEDYLYMVKNYGAIKVE